MLDYVKWVRAWDSFLMAKGSGRLGVRFPAMDEFFHPVRHLARFSLLNTPSIPNSTFI
jgi:hypothetical protein